MPDRPAGSPWSDAWRRFRRHRLAVAGVVALSIIGIAVVVGPMISPYQFDTIDLRVRGQGPTLDHPMGTDDLGRDQLVRVLEGGRISLAVGLSVVLVSVTLGVAVGAIAGFRGGLGDNILMRIVDVFIAIPGLFIVIVLVAILGASFWTVVVSLSLLRWPLTARLVRADFLSLKQREFVQAARVIGAGGGRIITRHLMPNALSPVIVASTLGVASAILTESALSYLGLGFQPPQASWGLMMQEAQGAMLQKGHWWRVFFPGMMIFLSVLSVNYLGDALRDALDPRRSVR
jgi:peptide/nickel transport system permease protein